MGIFEFTVLAVGEDLQSDENLEARNAAGCGDATVGRVEDLQWVAFRRESGSLGEAALTAVAAVEQAAGVDVIGVTADGSVRWPRLDPDPVRGALDALLSFRFHAAGLGPDIRETMYGLIRRPVRNQADLGRALT